MAENELKKYTSFQVGGLAENVYFPGTKEELVKLLAENAPPTPPLPRKGGGSNASPIILGAASNVLISSSGVKEDVIITTGVKSFQITDNFVEAECGAKGQLLARETQKAGLSGFEFMIGFPGTVGGMIYMNAGAHNQNISDVFVSCDVFDMKTKKVLTLDKADLKFSYRRSVLGEKDYVLLSAKFELVKEEQEKIDDIIERNIEFRKQRQPSLAMPNAGSVFKNPEGDSAGRLLDLAGVKALSVGGAKVFDMHANFIVNFNNATSLDISQLMLNMYNMVREKYNIRLKPEIKFIGTKTEEEQKIWEELLNN